MAVYMTPDMRVTIVTDDRCEPCFQGLAHSSVFFGAPKCRNEQTSSAPLCPCYCTTPGGNMIEDETGGSDGGDRERLKAIKLDPRVVKNVLADYRRSLRDQIERDRSKYATVHSGEANHAE